MLLKKISKYYIVLLIVLISTMLAFFAGSGKQNNLLIAFMCLSPFIFISFLRVKLSGVFLMIFMLMLIVIPAIHHPESLRLSTVFYTFLFCFSFMTYQLVFTDSEFAITDYQKVLRSIIYAYAIVLLLQQLCVLLGLPIINVSNYDFENPWKLNSLSSEPAHSARMVGLLMYSYIVTEEKRSGTKYTMQVIRTKDMKLWIAFLWIMLTMNSVTALLFLTIILFRFIRNRRDCLIVLLVGAIFVATCLFFKIEAFARLIRFSGALLTFDVDNIVDADHSASFRIIPFVKYISMIDLHTADGWFGHGIDYLQNNFVNLFVGVTSTSRVQGGAMIMAVDYGFLPFMIFVIYSLYTCCTLRDLQSIIFWLLITILVNINTQLAWMGMVLLWTNKQYLTNRKTY